MDSSSPDVSSVSWLSHSDLGLEDFVFTDPTDDLSVQGLDDFAFTDPTDDLSRLVATSTCSTLLEDEASMSLEDMGCRIKESTQKRGACELGSAETMSGTYGRSSKHEKVKSLNISLGHPDSYEDSTPFLHSDSKMRSFICTENEQAHGMECFVTCLQNELHPNVASRQPVHCSDIEHLQVHRRLESNLRDSNSSAVTFALTKKQPHSSLSSIQEGGVTVQDASTLSKMNVHIKAERERREKLNQRFIALSAIVPGLKKVDKATILGDAVKYMKHLEEQIKVIQDKVPKMFNSLEVQNYNESSCYPSTILDKKGEKVEGFRQPDIEARVVGKTVLIRVHCDKIKSVLVKALEELEKLQLSVVNANILSFSNMTIDLTVTAQDPTFGKGSWQLIEAARARAQFMWSSSHN